MINLYGISNILTTITSMAMALFVYTKGYRSKLCKTWSIFAICVAIYGFGAYMASGSRNSLSAFFWWQISYIGVIMLPALFIHFVYVFLNIKRAYIIRIVYILSLIVLAADIFSKNLFVGNVSLLFTNSKWFTPAWWIYPPGPLHIFYTLFLYIGLLIYAHVELIKAYKNSGHLKQQQIKYFFFATTLGFVGGGTSYLPCFGINVYPVLNITVPLYPLIMTYAIIRHQLMDIEVIIKKTLIYSVLISVITILYFIIVYTLEKIFSIIVGYYSMPLAITIITFFSIIFIPLKNKIQKFIDKYFFHGSIDQIDEENIKLREELQKAEKLKAVATLAAGMAHEIKNPLTSIKTFTEYISKKKTDPEFLEKFQKIVSGEVNRINYIVKQLLEFSKPSDLQLKETGIDSLLDETLDLLNNDFLKHNIKIEKCYSPLPSIKVDPSQMKQVFLNLLLNAIDSMETGGIITATIKPGKNDNIIIKIKDSGKGIEKEDLKHIFDPFFSKKNGGTGLGLSVVHGIIEKHGGKISVEGVPGHGTSFQINLPID